jgi:D-alanyl-D-alanine carboxypeptidase (penicillin-binding protein 5/6)
MKPSLTLAAACAATLALAFSGAATFTSFPTPALAQAPAAAPAATAAAAAPPPLFAPPATALKPPEVAARQYILVDLTSQQVLAESGADVPAEPASLTKLMTAYLVFNALREGKLALDQRLPVSQRAWDERGAAGAGPTTATGAAAQKASTGKPARGGSRTRAAATTASGKKPAPAAPSSASLMFIDPTMKPSVEELLHGLIVQSGNDAAVALAEGVAGSVEAFVAAMNRQAEAWGLKNTRYKNVTGLTEAGHHSSARDVAYVAGRIVAEHPKLHAIYSVKSYTYNGITQPNRNRLLTRDPTVDGMKTGRTDAAGWCLAATAVRDTGAPPGSKRRLVSVVLGSASDEARAAESAKLLDWGFNQWEAVRLFEPAQSLASARVWKGQANEARLGVAAALVVSVPRGEGPKLQSALTRTDPLIAPLAAGQAVGTVKVSLGGATVASVPLVALQEVPPAGWFGRTWDSLRLQFK